MYVYVYVYIYICVYIYIYIDIHTYTYRDDIERLIWQTKRSSDAPIGILASFLC